MKGFRVLGEQLFTLGLTDRYRLGNRVTAGGDTTAPTVTITSTESSPSFAATIPLTVTFSEAVTGFVVGDITVVGCTLSNFATANNIVWTVDATPTAGSITADIAAGVCQDGAGNNNTAATQFAITSGVLQPSGLSDGALPSPWTGSAFAIASNVIKNTPVAGSDVIINGTFDADSDWTKGTDWSIGSGVATKAAGASASSLQQSTRPANKLWTETFDATVSAGFFGCGGSSQVSCNVNSNGSYVFDFTSVTSSLYQIAAGTGASAGTFDNITCQQPDQASLIATVNSSNVKAIVKAACTVSTRRMMGVVSNLDSTSNPQNYILCFIAGGINTLYGFKMVGGSLTLLKSGAITYSAGANVEIRVTTSGSDLVVGFYYNGSQVSTDATVTDAGIKSNTRHGIFSMANGNSIGLSSVFTNP